MRTVLKIVGIIIVVLVVVLLGGYIFFISSYPSAGPEKDLVAEATPERIQRGEYLANHVTVCMDCHSTRDWDYFSGPIVQGTEGKGGERFDENMDLPGVIYAKNITPTHLADWSDGEVARAITSGVNRDGEALFPIMPYPLYNNLSQEDLYSIIAYVRTLKSLPGETPKKKLNFPLNLIVRTMPQPYSPRPQPDRADTIVYGRYFTTIGGCIFCHTPSVQGKQVEGMEFAGGAEFVFPDHGGTVRSANLTPDMETGIGAWSQQDFIDTFHSYSLANSQPIPAAKGTFNTVMSWTLYAGMTDEDLAAIYAFLHSLKPISHEVEKFTPAMAN